MLRRQASFKRCKGVAFFGEFYMTRQTFQIRIYGQVQGVGFRPFIFSLAADMGLAGKVLNDGRGVLIMVNGDKNTVSRFIQRIRDEKPPLALLVSLELEAVPFTPFADFVIAESDSLETPDVFLTPDAALCADCRREMRDPSNRRFAYSFITCTRCGPRYSITEALPFDRERTVMRAFTMCPACMAEYENPANRRHYSQTNSCPDCGIKLSLTYPDGSFGAQPLPELIALLNEGKIAAVQGIGGYLLLCDARNAQTLATLRRRKQRPAKPFAVLYPDLVQLAGDVYLSEQEKRALESIIAPIVLLELREQIGSGICTAQIAPGLPGIGAMLPYAPLLQRIADAVQYPLVATSGNLSGSPIVFQGAGAQTGLFAVADAILSHNRTIVVPQDDSVVRFGSQSDQAILIRRSRGLAPSFMPPAPIFRSGIQECCLAMGASIKSAFALYRKGKFHISQYLGDLEQYDTQRHFEHSLRHFLQVLQDVPGRILGDLHPNYFSTRLGQQLAEETGVPFQVYQHHKAHFAAVLAENALLESRERILGVIWDGAGLGDDGQIWGGEFFVFAEGNIVRRAAFAPITVLSGDKMAREPRLSALSAGYCSQDIIKMLQHKFTEAEWAFYMKVLQAPQVLGAHSAGRLFDAAACLLGLSDRNTYEGEAAMYLESLAGQYFKRAGLASVTGYPGVSPEAAVIPVQTLLSSMADDLLSGIEAAQVAARFHRSLVDIIAVVAQQEACRGIAFSGGVWQNALLVDLARVVLGNAFSLYFHRQLSPNDENVAFGQLVISLELAAI